MTSHVGNDIYGDLHSVGESQRQARRRKADQVAGLLAPYAGNRLIKSVLSIGSGFCLMEERLKEDFLRGADILCTDVDRERLGCFEQPQLTKKHISAAELDFEPESFDLILAHQVLEHTNQYPKALENITRICRKGGLIYINVPNPLSPALGKLPDGSWPKPFLGAWLKHNARKFRSDFISDTEKYHTGFTRGVLERYVKDYTIIDLRRDRLRQELDGPVKGSIARFLPICLFPLFIESNIWLCMKNQEGASR